jgi:nucleolar protein 15
MSPQGGAKRKPSVLSSPAPVKKKRLPPAEDVVKAAFMPLDTAADQNLAKRAKKKSKVIPVSSATGSGKSAVIYVGRIPHGFYEDQMRGFFSQFGDIKRLRLSRNKKTGKSKHYAFIEFESPEVAPIVAEAMHNYLLFESMLQVKVVPVEKLKPSMWVGANKPFKTIEWQKLAREKHNRVRTPKEQSRQLGLLVKKDQKRRKKLQDAGIDYDYPELKAIIPATSKKTTFTDNDD